MHEYQLVYDFASRSPKIGTMFLVFVWVLIGIWIFIYNKKYADKKSSLITGQNMRRHGMVMGIIFICAGSIISILVIPAMWKTYTTTKEIYFNKEYQIAEGIIEHFEPFPNDGRGNAKFRLDGIEFEYSKEGDSTYGYYYKSAPWLKLKDGINARIAYFNDGRVNVILKLEIK